MAVYCVAYQWNFCTRLGDFVKEEQSVSQSLDEFVDRFVEWCKSNPHCFHFIAEEKDKIIAMVSVVIVDAIPRPLQSNQPIGYLTNTYTIPEYRNKGIGTGLLNFVKQWATQEHNAETVIVWPSEKSISFYKRAGFDDRNDILELVLRE